MTNVIVGLLNLLASMFLTCFFYIYGLANFEFLISPAFDLGLQCPRLHLWSQKVVNAISVLDSVDSGWRVRREVRRGGGRGGPA